MALFKTHAGVGLTPSNGTDFFLIVNQIVDTRSGKLVAERSTLLAKLVWRFVI